MRFNLCSIITVACSSTIALVNAADDTSGRKWKADTIKATNYFSRSAREWSEIYETKQVNFTDDLYFDYNSFKGTTDYVDGEVVLSSDGTTVAVKGTNDFPGTTFYAIYGTDSLRNQWTYQFPIETTNGATIPGNSISLSKDGKGVAVGGLQCSPTLEYTQGVICYDFDSQRGPNFSLNDVGDEYGDSFGTTVSLNEDSTVLAVGSSRGKVYVYLAQSLILTGKLDGSRIGNVIDVGSPNTSFGNVVKVVGSKISPTVFIGGSGDNIAAYRYGSSTGWRKLGNNMETDGDGVSFDVAEDGNVVAVKYGDSTVKVYEYISNSDGSTQWTQRGDDLAAESGKFASLSISNDGKIVAVGSYNGNANPSARPGIVRLYEYFNNNWREYSLVLEDTRLEGIVDFGRSVSLSGDGMVLAVSAPAFTTVPNADSTQGYVAIFEASDAFPSAAPFWVPSAAPSLHPSAGPTASNMPSSNPATPPSTIPTLAPSFSPSKSMAPSVSPTKSRPPTPFPSPLPTPSTCEHDCECKEGSECDLSECKYNCNCEGGFCNMQKCEYDCRCKGGYCNMNRCGSNCQCENRGCQMDNCIYNTRCTSSSTKATSLGISGLALMLTLTAMVL